MDINEFEKRWQYDLTELEETRTFWDLRADEFNDHGKENEGRKRRTQMIDLLASRDMLQEHSEILDIGCGPGRYSIEFAKKSKQVVGIDISPKMIQYAQENAHKEKVDNTIFEVVPWETLNLDECNWNKKYDLVFASMCPGISSSDSLLKMCQASKGGCFLSSFVARKDELRDEMYRLIYGKDIENQWGQKIYYAINILWLSGYYPEVTYHDIEFEQAWPIEKAVELYSVQLKRMRKKNPPIPELEKKIADYLGKRANRGIVTEKIQSKIAWIYWKV